MKLLLIPEEIEAPKELRWTQEVLQAALPLPGLAEAAVDPALNALVCAQGAKRADASTAQRRAALIERALAVGPEGLTDQEKNELLADALAMTQLHVRLWTEHNMHKGWTTTRSPSTATPPTALARTALCC